MVPRVTADHRPARSEAQDRKNATICAGVWNVAHLATIMSGCLFPICTDCEHRCGQSCGGLNWKNGKLLLRTCYMVRMTKLLEQALRQIEQLPEAEQDAAAGALLDYVKHMRELRLTDAQVAEVRRRIANPDRKLLSLAEARERIARRGS
jgi:hypothetical protein